MQFAARRQRQQQQRRQLVAYVGVSVFFFTAAAIGGHVLSAVGVIIKGASSFMSDWSLFLLSTAAADADAFSFSPFLHFSLFFPSFPHLLRSVVLWCWWCMNSSVFFLLCAMCHPHAHSKSTLIHSYAAAAAAHSQCVKSVGWLVGCSVQSVASVWHTQCTALEECEG